MHEDTMTHELSRANVGQGIGAASDVTPSVIENIQKMPVILAAAAARPHERRRTIVALVSASIISLVVWGLILALNLQ
ncbi:MAG: hypothetical protein JWM82_706 [Myxococcales bacterium]|nr:hypothetical protein [Myxococcales bacterium]